jgi:hypothetical protein
MTARRTVSIDLSCWTHTTDCSDFENAPPCYAREPNQPTKLLSKPFDPSAMRVTTRKHLMGPFAVAILKQFKCGRGSTRGSLESDLEQAVPAGLFQQQHIAFRKQLLAPGKFLTCLVQNYLWLC